MCDWCTRSCAYSFPSQDWDRIATASNPNSLWKLQSRVNSMSNCWKIIIVEVVLESVESILVYSVVHQIFFYFVLLGDTRVLQFMRYFWWIFCSRMPAQEFLQTFCPYWSRPLSNIFDVFWIDQWQFYLPRRYAPSSVPSFVASETCSASPWVLLLSSN